ncbi:MAG: ABC transporter substrate-binding protein [Rhizobiaceae bacterium]
MMFRKALWPILLMNLAFVCAANSAEQIKVGFVAPLSGSFVALGKQMQSGADVAANMLGVELIEQEEACTPEGGETAARALVAQQVDIVVGFTCFESLNAALPILRDAGIVTIATGVRADVLTDNKAKSGFLLYRLAPREDTEVAALIAALLPRWREQNFAIIDDGTVQARNTAEALRFGLTEAGLIPVFTDTFRPGQDNQVSLVRRLQKAGATHLFVGGDIEDALVISKAAKGEMEIVVGETPNPEGGAEGTGTILSVSLPDYRLRASAAAASLALQTKGIEPDNYALTAHAAVEIAAAIGAAQPDIAKALSESTFTTAIGEIAFDAKGDVNANAFSVVILKDGEFAALGPSSQ